MGRNVWPSSWLWLVALFTFVSLIEGLAFSHVNAFSPLYLPSLGVSEAQVPEVAGRIVAISSAFGIPFVPFWGALADRFSRHPIIVRTFVVHLIGLVLMLVAGNVWVFGAGRAVISLGIGNSGLMMTTLTERVPRQRVTLAISIMSGALPLGSFIGPLFGGPVVDALGFRTLIAVDAALMLTATLAMTFGWRDTFTPASPKPILSMLGDSARIILGSPRLRALFPALFLLFAGSSMASIYVPLAVTSLYRGEEPGTAVGLVIGAGGLTTLLLAPMMGAAADRFGLWRVLLIGVAIQVVLWPLPLLADDLTTFAVFWALLSGVSSGVLSVSFSALSSSSASATRGRVMALSTFPMIAGSVVWPAVGSAITRESVFNIFPLAAGTTALGLGMLALAARQKAAKAVEPT
jgi:MFS family permease